MLQEHMNLEDEEELKARGCPWERDLGCCFRKKTCAFAHCEEGEMSKFHMTEKATIEMEFYKASENCECCHGYVKNCFGIKYNGVC